MTTVHCFVCDMCVNNWDHHCFWLNTCINDQNKKAFNFFYYTFIVDVFINTTFIVFSIFIFKFLWIFKEFFIGKIKNLVFFVSIFDSEAFENYFVSLFGLEKDSTQEEIQTYKLIWKIAFTVFFIAIVYTILYIIV